MLQISNIKKSFGAVHALKDVSLNVKAGEVHALIGENGAGKSTLMKVLSGVLSPDEGTMTLDGAPFRPHSPNEARNAGISMVYQELTLAPHLSIEENITLGLENSTLGWIKPQSEQIKEVLATLGQPQLDPKTPVHLLNIGQQQLIEIARALITKAKIVVFDEPTSSLSSEDASALFAIIRQLKEKGVSVIYISHFLEEIQEIADRFTVLRDGESVAEGEVKDTPIDAMIEQMIGRSATMLYQPSTHQQGEVLLTVSALEGEHKLPLESSFVLRRGEILGIAGLMGSGRSELIRTIFGLQKATNGSVQIAGHEALKAVYLTPPKALANGMNLLSEDRKAEGLALNLSILKNLTLSHLLPFTKWGTINLQKEAEVGEKWRSELNIKSDNVHQSVQYLSGGNQQKVSLARLLHHDSDILFLDEPTRGVDIGSKAEIYQLIQRLAAKGRAIVVVSSYLPELMGICDTIAVMHRGQLSQIRPTRDWTEHDIMRFATSGD